MSNEHDFATIIAKGRGGKEALKIVGDIPGLNLVLLTMPFFYSNFLAFFVPLPNKAQNQWELSAAFGDGAIQIDMMNCSDLGHLVGTYSLSVDLLSHAAQAGEESNLHLHLLTVHNLRLVDFFL